MGNKQLYNININKLLHDNILQELEPIEVAMLIVAAGFHRPFEENELYLRVSEIGLDKMNEEELIEWINKWKEEKKQQMFN